jgi:hypothetical protein
VVPCSRPVCWGTEMELLFSAIWLMLPIVIGGVAHMVFVTRDWWPALKRPLHPGWFGANKTWRGFVVMPLLSIPGAILLYGLAPWLPDLIGVPLLNVSPLLLGLLLGLGYVLAELPNSYFKRRVGIAAGATPEKGKLFFVLMDQLDSAFGFALVYWLITGIDGEVLVLMVVLFPAVALMIKRLLYWARLKKSYL